jgi:hypothetical protein
MRLNDKQFFFAVEVSESQAERQKEVLHHSYMKRTWFVLLGLLLSAAPAAVQAQYTNTNADGSIYVYSTNADGSITIDGYIGPPWAVTIPTNINGLLVTGIGPEAFYDYALLTSITIPNSVTSIGNDAFTFCNDLTSVTIPGSVSNIGEDPFGSCRILIEITVDATNSFYSSLNGVLFNKSLTTLIQYPGGISGGYAILGSVTNIGQHAFFNCYGLTNVMIPVSVTSIGDLAFSYAGLTDVMVPGSVTNIGSGAFADCINLASITVDLQNSYYSSVNGVLFDKNLTTLIQYPGGISGGYAIPESVTSIGQAAFVECFGLANVAIPGSVTNIGDDAFEFCDHLASVTITNGVTIIGDHAFNYCYSLTNVAIPASVASIGEYAFAECWDLTSVMIPNSVTNIGVDAFAFCYSLASIYFQGNAPTADSTAFYYDNATAYYLPATTGWGEFSANTGLPTVLWNPLIQAGGTSFGVQNNQFGFNITGTANIPIIVEACTNLASPVWTPLQTLTLTNGLFYLSDPQWTNYFGRFYRISSP